MPKLNKPPLTQLERMSIREVEYKQSLLHRRLNNPNLSTEKYLELAGQHYLLTKAHLQKLREEKAETLARRAAQEEEYVPINRRPR